MTVDLVATRRANLSNWLDRSAASSMAVAGIGQQFCSRWAAGTLRHARSFHTSQPLLLAAHAYHLVAPGQDFSSSSMRWSAE